MNNKIIANDNPMITTMDVSAVTITKKDKMGTSGTRLKAPEFNRPGFHPRMNQAICDHWHGLSVEQQGNKVVIVGGDPRNGNPKRIQEAALIAAANGFKPIVPKDNGLAPTPAISAAIMTYKAMGGIIETASHNPAEDVGIKTNLSYSRGAGPALEEVTEDIFVKLQDVKDTKILNMTYSEAVEKGLIQEVDMVKVYVDFMKKIFDTEIIKQGFKGKPFQLLLDPMHGASGPYAKALCAEFGIKLDMINAEPLPFFGPENEHRHPEPEPRYLEELIGKSSAYNLSGGYDGDGDRNLHYEGKRNITAGDLAALMAEHYGILPIKEQIFKGGQVVMGRSIVSTSQPDLAIERLQREGQDIKMVATPTGFKFIAELGNFGFEESNGHGNPWHGEKDGMFATMFQLYLMAKTQKTLDQLLQEIYKKDGRAYFTRGGITCPKDATTQRIMGIINNPPKEIAGFKVLDARIFNYKSPVTGLETKNAAYMFKLESPTGDILTLSMRFSGTGTGDPLLRTYVDCVKKGEDQISARLDKALDYVRPVANEIVGKVVEFPELDFYAKEG
ncbi:MAG: hypothetical protein PHV30_05655 [Candidatus Margulisbacteria bacterium]|nr:hypothetical protein [Candidatus Margulisiibacteriota bacterium]